jgi:N-acetylglucosamine-6-phosphate deacetylase
MAEAARESQLITFEGDTIAEVRAASAGEAHAHGAVLADIVTPGFIDLQINGAKDRQFNFDPSVETLERIAEGARAGGTAYLLPTFITAPDRDYQRALAAARRAIERGVPGILGLHLEGPFLSPARAGIHDPAAIRSLDDTDVAALTAPFPGPLLLTVAPEEVSDAHLSALRAAGLFVFAGHSAATAERIGRANELGLRGATHLFNAMSQMSPREPGVVGAVLASPSLYAGVIADGHHVAPDNLKIAARLMPDRLCLVTDAMLTLAGTIDRFDLHGEAIRLQDGRLTNARGRLAGAHLAMNEAVRTMTRLADLPLGLAVRMASANPADAIGQGDRLGRVKPGARASMSLFDADLVPKRVLVDGAWQFIA